MGFDISVSRNSYEPSRISNLVWFVNFDNAKFIVLYGSFIVPVVDSKSFPVVDICKESSVSEIIVVVLLKFNAHLYPVANAATLVEPDHGLFNTDISPI